MDVNKVVFGNFSIGPKNGGAKESREKQEAQQNAQISGEFKNVDAETVFSALNVAGLQNKAHIAHPERKEINPNDYLSEDRINDIEAMMGKFENGVGVISDAIEEELPGFFAADTRNALAAKIFAQE